MIHSPEQIQKWLRRIVSHEGGLSLDRNDRGNWYRGELVGTKWGLSAATYGTHVLVSRGRIPIRETTIEDAAEVYKRDFLDPLNADRYDDGVAYQMLDFAVNSGAGGIKAATRRLQAKAGLVADGIIGPNTRAKMEEYTEAQIVMLILHARILHMVGAPTWAHHGAGWMRRIAENLIYGVRDTKEI